MGILLGFAEEFPCRYVSSAVPSFQSLDEVAGSFVILMISRLEVSVSGPAERSLLVLSVCSVVNFVWINHLWCFNKNRRSKCFLLFVRVS